jgi:MFS family permease
VTASRPAPTNTEGGRAAVRSGLLRGPRSFKLFWGARTVSIAGNQIALVALTVLVYQLGASPAGVSVLLLAFTLPRLLGPLAGAIVDRSDNKRLMVACDLAQALLFAGLTLVRWWPGVIAMVLAATSFSTLYSPAGRGNVPALAGRDNLARANAQLAAGSNAALALGPAFGGILLALGGTRPALLANVATFVFSAALTLGIRGLRPGTSETRANAPVTVLGQARAGLGVVWQNRVARAVAIMLLPGVAFASLDNAALIFLIRQGFHAGAGSYGWVITAYSVGMVGMPLVLSALGRQLDARRLLFSGQGLFGVGTIATGLAPGLAFGIGTQVAAGAGNGLENIGIDTLLQESAPDEELGKVFGTVYTAPYAGQIIAYLGAAPLIVAIGPRAVFLAAGGGVLVTLFCLAWTLPSRRPAELDLMTQK